MIEVNGIVFNKIGQQEIDFIRNNFHLPIKEIEETLGISDETIYRIFRALNIKRKRLHKIYLPYSKEVEDDLKNPYLSHVLLGIKYGVSESTIALRRKKLGYSIRKHTCPTLLEEKIRSILEELDLAYLYEKRISDWSIDFYLGNKTCIDVHGEHFHSSKQMLERDARKAKYLESNGYQYLAIKEKDIDKAKELIINFLGCRTKIAELSGNPEMGIRTEDS